MLPREGQGKIGLTWATIQKWALAHCADTIQDHIEDAIADFYLENPSEKELKAIMTSNGKILIKSAKKTESTESVHSSQEENNFDKIEQKTVGFLLHFFIDFLNPIAQNCFQLARVCPIQIIESRFPYEYLKPVSALVTLAKASILTE